MTTYDEFTAAMADPEPPFPIAVSYTHLGSSTHSRKVPVQTTIRPSRATVAALASEPRGRRRDVYKRQVYISYDSSAFYITGGLKVQGLGSEELTAIEGEEE